MKKISYTTRLLLCMLPMGFIACSDYEDDRLDFSNNAPMYVKFTSVTSKTLVEGNKLSVQVETPLFTTEDITVNYTISGDITGTGTVTIPAGAKLAKFNIVAPDNSVPTATKTATVAITSVSNGLTVGRAGLSTSFTLKVVDDDKIAYFEAGEVTGLESVDTVGAVFALTNPATSATTVTYTITGGTEGVDYEDEGHGSVVIEEGESSVDVPVTILDNQLRNDPPVVLTITITGATSADTETSFDDEANVLEYTIADDLKTVGVVGGDVKIIGLTKAAALGSHAFDISLDMPTDQEVVVHYSISGTGVTDVTGGTVTFYPGGTLTQQIVINLESAAFNADQSVVITLNSITSADEEVVFAQDENGDDAGTTITLGIKK